MKSHILLRKMFNTIQTRIYLLFKQKMIMRAKHTILLKHKSIYIDSSNHALRIMLQHLIKCSWQCKTFLIAVNH